MENNDDFKIPMKPHPAVTAFSNALTMTLNNHNDNKAKKKNNSPVINKVSQTLGWRNRYSQSEYYPMEIHYNKHNDHDSISNSTKKETTTLQIKQVQRGEIENTYGTGATVWPSSLVLVKYLEHKQQKWYNKVKNRKITIADLGSGTGVTSIAVAYFLGIHQTYNNMIHNNQGSFIVCTDGIDSVVALAKENIENAAKKYAVNENQTVAKEIYSIGQSQIKVRKYLWGDGTLLHELKDIHCKDDSEHYFDMVIVSDCVLPRLYPIQPLVDAIDELSGPNTITYLSYEYRYYSEYDPKEFFVNSARKKGLEVRTVPIEEQHPIYSVDDIEIWEIRRNSSNDKPI